MSKHTKKQKYTITLKYDHGTSVLTTFATNLQNAVKQICKSQNCSVNSIILIERT